jgi:hypothetical protein
MRSRDNWLENLMLLAVLKPDEALPVLGIASGVFVLLSIFLVRSRLPLESKLLAAGLLTAVLAVWCGQLAIENGASVQIRSGAVVEGGRVAIADETAGTLARIAFVLVLGGVAVSILSRWNSVAAPFVREEASHGNVV